MTTEATGGLAAAHLWDISTSWSVGVGAVDTGGRFDILVTGVDFGRLEEHRPSLVEPAPSKPAPSLRELMMQDPVFWRLTEEGLADLEEKRFRLLRGLTE